MRVVVTQSHAGSPDAVRQVLLGLGLECGPADCVSYGDLPVRLSQGTVDLVVVRVNGDLPGTTAAVRQALSQTAAPVVAVGPVTDAQQILHLSRVGVREYLDEGRLQVDLQATLDKLRANGTVHRGQGHVLAVASATPGSGVTTVATNVAFTWAKKEPGRVALVELGREAADLALSLDLTPKHTVGAVAKNWQRMDATLLRQSMADHAGGVAVLTQGLEALAGEALEPQAVRKAIVLLRAQFTKAVLDLGHMLAEEHYEAMRLADTVAIVARLDVPALRQARALVRACTDHGVPRDRIRLVANRYGQKGQLAWKKAEEALGAAFAEYLPEDSRKFNGALNAGLPLVQASPGARVSKRFAKLAVQLNGVTKK
jgi:pilus assembly protein CpaE